MYNEKQDWGKAYQQIADLLLLKIPEIKHVDLYHAQEQIVDEDGNWVPFKCPAIFLQFDFVAEDLGELRQQLMVDVKVYLAFEITADSHRGGVGETRALQFIDVMRKVYAALHNFQADDIGPLSRVAMAREPGPPTWYYASQTFRGVMLDYGATRNWTELGDIPLNPGLEVNPMPPSDPSGVIPSVRILNSDASYDHLVQAPGVHQLPDVTHTDSDGSPVTLPGMTPFVATPGGGGGPCAPVSILDQNDNEIASVASGGTYHVMVLDEVNDEEPYDTYIINIE